MKNLTRFCPQCGEQKFVFSPSNRWKCDGCGFEFYIDAAAAVALVIECGGKVLLQTRKQEPRKGFLALPGGFVDDGESLEDACRRECREEIGLDLSGPLEYVGSFPNKYFFADVEYSTCDAFFHTILPRLDVAALSPQKSEVAEIVLVEKSAVPFEKIAFPSLAKALKIVCGR